MTGRKPADVRKNTLYERTLLGEWMEQQGVSLGSLARRLGVDRTSIQAWKVGAGLPSLVAAFRLEHVTAGKVPASSWLATSIGKHQWFTMEEKTNG